MSLTKIIFFIFSIVFFAAWVENCGSKTKTAATGESKIFTISNPGKEIINAGGFSAFYLSICINNDGNIYIASGAGIIFKLDKNRNLINQLNLTSYSVISKRLACGSDAIYSTLNADGLLKLDFDLNVITLNTSNTGFSGYDGIHKLTNLDILRYDLTTDKLYASTSSLTSNGGNGIFEFDKNLAQTKFYTNDFIKLGSPILDFFYVNEIFYLVNNDNKLIVMDKNLNVTYQNPVACENTVVSVVVYQSQYMFVGCSEGEIKILNLDTTPTGRFITFNNRLPLVLDLSNNGQLGVIAQTEGPSKVIIYDL